MSDYLKNGIVQGLLVILVVVLVLGLFGWLKFRRDEKIVTAFLKKSGIEPHHTSGTTHAISLSTNLSKERVRHVCRKSTSIERHSKDDESWKQSG